MFTRFGARAPGRWPLRLLAPLAGLEPTHTAPEADALSAELQGQDVLEGRLRPRSASGTVPASADGAAITGWE